MARPKSSPTLDIIKEVDQLIAEELKKREVRARRERLEVEARERDKKLTCPETLYLNLNRGLGFGHAFGPLDQAAGGDGALQSMRAKEQELLRKSVWKVPWPDVRVNCRLEKCRPSPNVNVNAKTKAEWTCRLPCGNRKLVLVAKKSANGSYLINLISNSSGEFGNADSHLIGTVEKRPNHIYELYDNGVDEAQLLMSSTHGSESNALGIGVRQKMETIRVHSHREYFRFWKERRTLCSCLLPQLGQPPLSATVPLPLPFVPKTSRHPLFEEDEDDELERLFSDLSWETSMSRRYQLISGQSTTTTTAVRETRSRSRSHSAQVQLTMCSPATPKLRVFRVSSFQNNAGSKCPSSPNSVASTRTPAKCRAFHIQFRAPLSLVHAFAIAICVIDNGHEFN